MSTHPGVRERAAESKDSPSGNLVTSKPSALNTIESVVWIEGSSSTMKISLMPPLNLHAQ